MKKNFALNMTRRKERMMDIQDNNDENVQFNKEM